ncbi:hypothetical protein Tco_1235910 [Tanacetum coccineum]
MALLASLPSPVPLVKKGVKPSEEKKVSLLHDNIVPKPDLDLELGKSISLTEAEEEAVAREGLCNSCTNYVWNKPDPSKKNQTGINSWKDYIVLASIKSQSPYEFDDKYLGTKLDDALLKILERHTADLIEKYSALPGPESIKNQESEKSPKEIIRIKREQGKEKQDSTYSFKHKVALEEFDLKSALFKHMNKNKTANRNPANYHLYHALMEALIAIFSRLKTTKESYDRDDEENDEDDEGPSLIQTRVGQQREEDPISPLLGQLSSFEK